MAAVRLRCAERDRVDARSVVEGLPTAAEIAEASAKLEEPSKNRILAVYEGSVVGYATIRWWQERDDTWLYLHRGCLVPEHRGQGIGSAMLSWAEERIRQLVEEHGTARTAVIGANAAASGQDATALLLAVGYRRVFSLVELELSDLQQLPKPDGELPAGIRIGPIGTSHYRAVWRTVVDSYADTGFTQKWPFLSVRTDQRRLGIGRALLLDGLRSLRGQGATTARLYTGAANPHRSFDLYESVEFRRQNEYVRYRKPLA